MSNLTSITSLFSDIEISCPGVTENYAMAVLRDVIKDFAVRTSIWRETIAITTVADQQAYALTPSVS